MKPAAVVVRYRRGDRGGGEEGRGATFHDRSGPVALGRHREVRRFSAWIEVVDPEQRDAPEKDARATTGAGSGD